MEAKDTFSLTWCEEHKNWYQYNCPDCMIDANEQDIKRVGRKEVVECIRQNGVGYALSEAKLKEWGIK